MQTEVMATGCRWQLPFIAVVMRVDFQMFAGRMSQPLLRLVGLWQEFQQANIAVKRLGDILDMPQEPHTLTPTRENHGPGRIDLSHLAFRYTEHHPWLYRNLSLTLKPGHLTVLTGPSGCANALFEGGWVSRLREPLPKNPAGEPRVLINDRGGMTIQLRWRKISAKSKKGQIRLTSGTGAKSQIACNPLGPTQTLNDANTRQDA